MIAAVIVLRVPARMSPGSSGNKLSNATSVTILGSGEGLTSFEKNNGANFSCGNLKSTIRFCGVSIFREYARKLKLNLVHVVAVVFESKGL